MQNIHVDKILEAVLLLHDRYQFESPHTVNRWLVMTIVKAGVVPDDMSVEKMLAGMPANFALADKEQSVHPDVAKDIWSVAVLLTEQMSGLFMRLGNMLEADPTAECWISYHEITPSTYALSIRDGDTDPLSIGISVFNPEDWPAADSIHVRDGQIIPEEVQ